MQCSECGATSGDFYSETLCGPCFDQINDAVSDDEDARRAVRAQDLYNEIAADNDVPAFRFLSPTDRAILLDALDALIVSLTD